MGVDSGTFYGLGSSPKTEHHSKARAAIQARIETIRAEKFARGYTRKDIVAEFMQWHYRNFRPRRSRLDQYFGFQHRKPRHVSLQDEKAEWHG